MAASLCQDYLRTGRDTAVSSILHVVPVDRLRGSSQVLQGGGECYDPNPAVTAGRLPRTGRSRTSPVGTSLVVTSQTGTRHRGTCTARCPTRPKPPTARPESPTEDPKRPTTSRAGAAVAPATGLAAPGGEKAGSAGSSGSARSASSWP